MRTTWTIITALLTFARLDAADANPKVTVYIDYDSHIPADLVFRAHCQVTRIFSKINVPVQFRGKSGKRTHASQLELDLYIGLEAPDGMNAGALALAHPFRQDGRIEVFYSRIQNFRPVESRDMALAYVISHEIAHALEGVSQHSPSGVMKARWDGDDFHKIQTGKLEFDEFDVQLIRTGIEKRRNDNRLSIAAR
jgi:hypothetical protein